MATIHKMDFPPTQRTQQAAQFDALLEQSRDLICERLDHAVAAMLDHAKGALTTLVTETRNFEERRRYEEARNVVVTQRETMEKQFRTAYLAEFRRRSDRARKIGQAPGEADDELGQLSLIGEDDFEETLKFNNMAGKLRAYCDEELVALDQRVGVLLGDANLQANDNPFSPQVICDAYKQACRQVDADAAVRRVLLKLFDDHVLDDVRSMYKAVNGLLVQNAILPKIRYAYSRSQDRRGPAAGGGAPGDVNAPDITTGVAQDVFAVLQNLAAINPVAMGQQGVFRGMGGAGVPGAGGMSAGAGAVGLPGAPGAGGTLGAQLGMGGVVPFLQGAELQSSLTRIQQGDFSGVAGGSLTVPAGVPGTTNMLRELRTSSVGAGMGSLDLMTLDIVSMLFDQLFDDPKVPNGVKGLIGRLQIPMLKVAIADKSFFSTKAHPARRLLDTLGEVAAHLSADFSPANPLFARLQDILEELVEGFRDNLEIFSTTRERVEALLAEEDLRVEQETRDAARRMEEMEHLAIAKRAAEIEVKARVQGHKLPQPVVEFLGRHWLKLLLLLHVKEGKDSPAWKGAVEAMDHLIWSLEPRSTPLDRRELVSLIPGLIRKLAVGLKAAGIEDEVRAQFFAQLIKLHRHAITAQTESAGDAAYTEAAPGVADSAAAAGERAAAPGEATAGALDFTAPVTVENPFGGGEVKVESLDLDFSTLETDAGPASHDAAPPNPVTELVMGKWVEFREADDRPARRPARLVFVTPRKTRYLFAFDKAGKDIIPFTPAELDRRFRLGSATLIDEPRAESLFDRIMKGLVSKLRTPATA